MDKMIKDGIWISAIFVGGMLIGYTARLEKEKESRSKTSKRKTESYDYIDGYEDGCRAMDKFWKERLKKMGFFNS